MTRRVNWVAAKGKSRDEILYELDLKIADNSEESLDLEIFGFQFGEWYIVKAINDSYHDTEYYNLKRLSRECEVIFCDIHDLVGATCAIRFSEGKLIWYVSHNRNRGPDDLIETGVFPDEYARMKERFLKQRESEGDRPGIDHLLELPIEIAESITGFRYETTTLPSREGAIEEDRLTFEIADLKRNIASWLAIIAFPLLILTLIVASFTVTVLDHRFWPYMLIAGILLVIGIVSVKLSK